MKKIFASLMVMIFGLMLIGCGDYDHKTKEGIAKDYGLADEHSFVASTIEEVLGKIEAGDKFLVYYGNPKCVNCQTDIKIFQQYADYLNEENDVKIDKIYYINTLDYVDEELSSLKTNGGVDDYKNIPQLWLFDEGVPVKESYKDFTSKALTFAEAAREIFELYIAE